MTNKEGSEGIFLAEFRFSSFKIGFDFLYSQISQVYRTNLTSFTANAEFVRVQIDGRFVECGQFRYTQAGRVDTFDNRRITFSLNRTCIDLIENPDDFRSVEKCHFAIFLFNEIN